MNNTWIALQYFIAISLGIYGFWALYTFIVYICHDLPEKRRKRTLAGLYKIRMRGEEHDRKRP